MYSGVSIRLNGLIFKGRLNLLGPTDLQTEDEDNTLFRNVGVRPPAHAASRPGRMESSVTLVREPQNSQRSKDCINLLAPEIFF